MQKQKVKPLLVYYSKVFLVSDKANGIAIQKVILVDKKAPQKTFDANCSKSVFLFNRVKYWIALSFSAKG